MGFFFRKSARFGPLRLNFSKSGVGASVGVKGARLTMTPRGTTYITVGTHGFYYRETLSNRSGNSTPAPSPVISPDAVRAPDEIVTADVSELVDSSNEALVDRLNQCAKMFNPAWVLYVIAAVMLLGALAMFVTARNAPEVIAWNLPDVTSPLSFERKNNSIDEYSKIVARYGEPNSVLSAELSGILSVQTAHYSSAPLKVIFVRNGCVETYEKNTQYMAERSRLPGPAKRKVKDLTPCVPSTTVGWTIVGYIDSDGKSGISSESASTLLDKLPIKRTSPPLVEIETSPGDKQKPNSRRPTKKQTEPPPPEMQVSRQAQVAGEQLKQDVEASERRAVYAGSGLLLAALGLLVAGVIVHKKNTEKRVSRLFYELTEAEAQKYSIVQQALSHIAKSQVIWRIEGSSETSDWKRNAGASKLVRRVPISVGCSPPPRVQANVSVPCMNVARVRLFFLPDVILYWEHGTYGAIAYADLRVEQHLTRFIEDGYVPADATVVDRTWRYVNKGGGPDRRFNNNVQLPVAQYGVLLLSSSRGLNIHLNTSSAQVSQAFANCWGELQSRVGSRHERQPTPHNERAMPPSPQAQAFKILGLSANASPTDISLAYRHLAQMYHPDKVAGLAPEFCALAEQRMKEINAAYAVLKS